MALTHFPADAGANELPTVEALRALADVADLRVERQGAVVRLSGTAGDADARERLILTAGNVVGIGTVDDDLSVASTPDGGSEAQSAFQPSDFHRVKPGESWTRLAELAWGDGALAPELHAANTGLVPSDGDPPAGWVIRAPRR